MKIILLYGPGEVGKRNEALRVRKQFSPEDITHLDLKGGLKELELSLVSPSLFESGPRLIVAENTPETSDLQKLNGGGNLTLLLLSGSLKAGSLLLESTKKLGGKITLFEGEKEVTAFPFLDALIEKRSQAFVELQKLLAGYGGMYVLSMIYYLLRRNLLPLPASIFMQQKVKSQKREYQLTDWVGMYRRVLETEFNIKSGFMTEELGLIFLTEKFLAVKNWE